MDAFDGSCQEQGPTMPAPRAIVLRAPGANCDLEAQFALEQAGAIAERVHINRLREDPRALERSQILVIPGGFTYGDDVAAGKILGNQLAHFLGEALRRFRDEDKVVLGICNGFQALLKAGLIVPPDEGGPLATLAGNGSGKFEDRWVTLQADPGRCAFLQGCDRLFLPVAHGEGRMVFREPWILSGLAEAGQVVLRYANGTGEPASYPANPNASEGNVAGLCDASGRVLGLMPHPERHVLPTQHPHWTRQGLREAGDGLVLFRNAVQYFE
jgi:phosphoribosylformylglycinamidine synthase